MQAHIINQYIWLVSTIAGAGEISIEEIDHKWKNSSLNDDHETFYPRRSFLRHKNDIEEIFGIHIAYRRLTNTYYIANSDDLHMDGMRNWMMNSFAINNALSESQSLRNRIVLEEIPEGTQYLPIIISAMRNSHKIKMTHQRFGKEAHDLMLDPYCIRVFKQRWYVYGRPSDYPKERRIYALDRISKLQESMETFRLPKNFDAETEFDGYYGTFTDEKIQLVRVRVINKGAEFMRTLPLHHSQREVFTGDKYSEFEFLIAPTFDFIQQLMTYGAQLLVLKPQWLHDRLQTTVKQMVEQYEHDQFMDTSI